ncbi:zinc finger C3HC-type protein 1 [Gastrophryne carolinensis]
MAAPSTDTAGSPLRSPLGTPNKVRELINEGIVSEERANEYRKDTSIVLDEKSFEDSPEPAVPEATNKEAFFSRVESFNSLKWAGKPLELSPLACAMYGWTNIECDMLKCCSCNAYLCASLHPALDFNKYIQRCVELQESLKISHEKYCFWPDSPCPEHFWALLVSEPSSILGEFTECFQKLCLLELQLPAFRHEDLKNMDLSEETVSLVLRLIENELKPEDGVNVTQNLSSESLQVHISACILALCGWCSSPSSGPLPLSIISCHRCTRKVGLWNFQQLDSIDLDSSFGTPSTPVSPGDASDRGALGVAPPNKRATRNRDAEQSPVLGSPQPRSGSSSSVLESDAVRSRPVTRSMGQGDLSGAASEVQSSPHRKAKRPRLCSSSSSDSTPKCCFDPLSQHKSWCPWVSMNYAGNLYNGTNKEKPDEAKIGWKEVLRVLLMEEKSRTLPGGDSSNFLERSRKVFRIFRQWSVTASS